LCQWWKDGGFGICALVGMGGVGKTAIIERFLQVLPGGYPEHPKVSKYQKLEAPVRVLVLSFYDAPNPDTFFTELRAWLEALAPPQPEDRSAVLSPYGRILQLLAALGKCLLVLDGLEKVQDDGSRGTLGQILDGQLRDFIIQIGDGRLPKVSLVVTSRFRLFDPLASRAWYYRQIEVEQLHPVAAVQLLRDRGVHGTTQQLEHVALDQGFHALSVDLAGGYIAYFCNGDPQRLLSLSSAQTEAADDDNPGRDPRLAALREQERKFARLAERYQQALAESDPAALALLQRVCLFRLGAEIKTLVAIFTGEGKAGISGETLANLNEKQLQTKLRFLVELRLAQISKTQNHASQVYTVHPAVRDGFLKGLDIEVARQSHDAARKGLEASLGGQPGVNPSDSLTLDLLEEIVYHTLATGHVQEAWGIYLSRIGGYKNLGWRLGAYGRSERILRAFVTGRSPQMASLPERLSRQDQATFINGWGLYLLDLGQLDAASQCYERARDIAMQQKNWEHVAIYNQNLADVSVLSGRLMAGVLAADEAIRFAERVPYSDEKRASYGFRAPLSVLRGEINLAVADFFAGPRSTRTGGLPYGLAGTRYCDFLTRLGLTDEAAKAAIGNKNMLLTYFGKEAHSLAKCNILLGNLYCESNDLASARKLLGEAHEWALQRDAKEPLCWAALVRAKIELSTFRYQHSENDAAGQSSLERAASDLEVGLRFARGCGYGIYHIDLLLLRAQLALYEGRAADAERDVRVALDQGDHPPSESGFPELLAATDPECLYAWGIAEGRHLLGEALLLQAAQKLGQAEFVPKRLDRLPAEARDLIGRAREQLGEALELWRKLKDPESAADINPRGERTRRVIEQLDGGVLTEYPLEVKGTGKPAELSESSEPGKANKETKAVSKKYVFLSYCRDNRTEVAKLHDELIAAGEIVWWDQDTLPGQDWKFEIRKAMRNAYAVVLCLSQETAARTTSGIYPEALDAIAAYREYSPGNIFLIPVRLSECEVPPIEIDGTRTLDRIQFVDLFPPAQRASGFARLVIALRAALHHP